MRSRYTLLRTSSSSSVDILRQKWAKRLIFWTGISISTLFISTMLLFYYAYTYYDGDDSDSSGYGRELELEALLTPIDLRGGDGGRRSM
jgi:hypothetical protein